ncbi:hypothetical protein PQ456_01385 [Paenibacillus kyungheensis]|uniref:Uncharacterized protein n=1 Tax=Paenibacillus kyungheensis TaxID=1452732 RepID=A0AAX3M209_9BACL|nr:hypothetical protein [Paenibacillus kyungheensis]WCT56209.1 hypothetical protein PQ456_01385 [Paenibacillus kyungheensis]
MLETFDFRDGKVNFNYFGKIDYNSSPQEDDYFLSEDMLSLSYADNKYIIDIGWYDSNQSFVISLIKDDDWEFPQKKEKVRNKEKIEEVLTKFIELVYENI